MKKRHTIEDVRFEGDTLSLIIDGREKKFPVHTVSPVLETASDEEKNTFEVSFSGYGIHWPLLDEDISIDALLGIVHSPAQKQRIS